MTVRVARLVCAGRQRHAIVSVAYESASGAPAPKVTRELMGKFVRFVEADLIHDTCQFCGSLVSMPPEDVATNFATMGDAVDDFERLAAEQERQLRYALRRAANN